MSFVPSPFSTSTDYAELRYHQMRKLFINLVDGKLVGNHLTQDAGTCARVLKHGYWGFASNADKGSKCADKLLNKAFLNAKAMAGFGEKIQPVLPTDTYQGEHIYQGKALLTRQECIEWLNEMHAMSKRKYKDLISTSFSLVEEQHQKYIQNSFGAKVVNRIDSAYGVCVFSIADKQGKPVELMDFLSEKGTLADFDLSMSSMEERLERLYLQLLEKRDGVHAKGGKHTVILAPNISGLLAHEAMGHPCEADAVLGGAVTGDLVGQQVASNLVSMTDFAHSYQGQELIIPVYADDEGTAAKDVQMIKNGVLTDFMHNRESTAVMQQKSTGNARAYAPNDEPLIRMRNTAILPGKDNLKEMIAGVEEGYLLTKTSNGQADSTTEFMFGISLGYEIKNGEIGRALKDTTVSGKAIDMLKTVDAVSTDMSWMNVGYCGKKQPMVVSMGGPALRAVAHLGGE